MEFNELRNCFAFIYGEEILIIINCMSQIRDMEEELFDLYSLLKQKKLSMGVSNGFCDISLLRQYYQQALAALNFGMKLENNQNIFFWQNFCIYDMFERVNLDILNGYIHPDIMTLHGYDVKNGTDLCHTLLVYLNCNRSQAKTAQILYIHRNTVNYRIHQCREIMGSDLKADTDLFSYTLSLMILAYHFTK